MVLLVVGIQTKTTNNSEQCDIIYYDKAQITLKCSGLTIKDKVFDIGDYITLPKDYRNQPVKLIMSFTNMQNVSGRPFQGIARNIEYLDLSQTNITHLPEDMFSQMSQLKYLDLSMNPLCFTETSFPNEVFKDLKSLEVLKVLSTWCKKVESYPHVELGRLISMKALYIRGINNGTFGEGMKSLVNLEKLVFAGRGCHMSNISHDLVKHLNGGNNLKELSIVHCKVKHVDPGLLKTFTNLTRLNLACNKYLTLPDAMEVVHNLGSGKLDSLVLDNIHHNVFNKIDREMMCHKSMVSVRRLSMRACLISFLDTTVTECLPHLQHLAIGDNPLMVAKQPENNTNPFIDVTNLEVLDVSYGFTSFTSHAFSYLQCHKEDFEDFFVNIDHLRKKIGSTSHYDNHPEMKTEKVTNETGLGLLHLPPKLRFILAQHFPWYQDGPFQHVSPDNQVMVLNISNTRLSDLQHTMAGLHHLRVLDLSMCDLQSIPQGHWLQFPHLTHLYLSSNRLGYRKTTNYGYQKTKFDDILSGLTSLQVLDLSRNGINMISSGDLDDMESLTYLDLSKNGLSILNPRIRHIVNMTFIDVSYNNLKRLEKQLMKDLDCLMMTSETITVDIRENPIVCDCSNMDFFVWINQTSVNVILDGGNIICDIGNMSGLEAVQDPAKLCPSLHIHIHTLPTWELAVLCGTSLVVMIIVVFLAHRFRWTLRFLNLTKYTTKCCRKQTRDRLYSYNVYIVFAKDDIRWIVGELAWYIEQEWGMRACLSFRDYRQSLSTRENIVYSLDNSAKVIVVVSSAYVGNPMAKFELEMAIAHNPDSILVVQKEECDLVGAPQVLRQLVKRSTVLTWRENNPKEQEDFWLHLQAALDVDAQTQV